MRPKNLTEIELAFDPQISTKNKKIQLKNFKKRILKTRKLRWDVETLDALADKMINWIMENPNELFLRKFFTLEGLFFGDAKSMTRTSGKFERAYKICQQECSDRIHDGILSGKISNSTFATKFMHFFDNELAIADLEFENKKLRAQLEETKAADMPASEMKVVIEVEK